MYFHITLHSQEYPATMHCVRVYLPLLYRTGIIILLTIAYTCSNKRYDNVPSWINSFCSYHVFRRNYMYMIVHVHVYMYMCRYIVYVHMYMSVYIHVHVHVQCCTCAYMYMYMYMMRLSWTTGISVTMLSWWWRGWSSVWSWQSCTWQTNDYQRERNCSLTPEHCKPLL